VTRVKAKALALVAVVGLSVHVSACARPAMGSVDHEAEPDSTAMPFVKNGGLVALIPEDAQIMELVGRPALVIETTGQGLRSMPNVAVSEPKCFGAIYAASEYEYRGSGYHASFGLQGDDPDTAFTPDVVVGATTFDDSTSAQQFVDDEIVKWSGCVDRPLNAKDTDSHVSVTWVAASSVTANVSHTVTRSLEGRRGFGCTRALAARSNVVADADVCAADATTTVGQASTLVKTVVDNIGR
jgi:hypothetical protein